MHSIQCSANYFPGLRLFLIEKFSVLVLVFEGIAANCCATAAFHKLRIQEEVEVAPSHAAVHPHALLGFWLLTDGNRQQKQKNCL